MDPRPIPIRQRRDARFSFKGLAAFVLLLVAPNNAYIITNRVKVFKLPSDAKERMEQHFETARLPDYRKNLKTFKKNSLAIVEQTLEEKGLHDLLDDLRVNVQTHFAVLIRGLPVDKCVPPCPKEKKSAFKKDTQVAEALLLAIGQLAGGEPVGYKFEHTYSHPIIHDSCLKSSGSALTNLNEQDPHQDMSYLSCHLVPDLLGLVCVRKGYDDHVTTDLIDNRDILKFVPLVYQRVLMQSLFVFKTPTWVKGQLKGTPVPLLTGPKLAPSLAVHVDWQNMMAINDEGKEALKVLQDAIRRASRSQYLNRIHSQPGDLIIFNNRRLLHRRSAYQRVRNDGLDRLLLRAYFSKVIKAVMVRKME